MKSLFYLTASLLYKSGKLSIHQSINDRADIVEYDHQMYDYKAMRATKDILLGELVTMTAKQVYKGVSGVRWTNNGIVPMGYGDRGCMPTSWCNVSPFS